MLKVEVVYAMPDRQVRYMLELEDGATVGEAVARSGALAEFPDIDLARSRVAIYGRLVALGARLGHGDRVEILRPLIADPKAVRRRRAARTGR
jgi:putative ubiquitin-RnfH superfamily antitoxin RatB of RatAB toxin-antitoxin module